MEQGQQGLPDSKYQQIVWLASYPKSGNTWLRMFLDAYFLGDVDINEVVTSVTDDLAARHQIGDGSDVRTLPVEIQQLTRPMALLRLVMAFNANKFANMPLFVKTHNPNLVANGIDLLPVALTRSTIYLVRDPRDVAPSFARHTGTSVDKAIDGMLNRHNVLREDDADSTKTADVLSSWPTHANSFKADDQHGVLLVRYEDLKKEPERGFKAILNHAGVPVDEDRIFKAIETTRLENLRDQEEQQGFKEASPYAERFFRRGKGKDELTKAQRVKIENKMGRMMKRLGYL